MLVEWRGLREAQSRSEAESGRTVNCCSSLLLLEEDMLLEMDWEMVVGLIG
jgi:hypothetical protein